MEQLLRDLRHAARRLRKSPGFAVLAVSTLALGIGLNTAVFSVVDGVLLRPLPYPEADRLVTLVRSSEGHTSLHHSPLNISDLTSQSGVFVGASAFETASMNLAGRGEPERIDGARVSWSFFDVLGVSAVLGRTFTEADGERGDPNVVVISYGLWRRLYGGRDDAVGTSLALDGTPYTVVGVTPRGLDFPRAEVWRPLVLTAEQLDPTQRGASYLRAIGRLKPGISPQAAAAAVRVVGDRLAAAHPRSNEGTTATVIGLQEQMVRDVRPALVLLLGAVGLVLLIACANVANLLLARSADRRGEIAIRSALGAGRRRLAQQLLVESMLVAAAGGAGGLVLAAWCVDLLVAVGPAELPRLAEVSVDLRVLAYAVAATLASGLLAGVVPTLRATRGDLDPWMRAGAGRGTTARTPGVLVVGEVALAAMLLAGAALLVTSFARLRAVDPGFDPRQVTTFALALPTASYPEPHHVADVVDRLVRGLEAQPGVRSAAAVFGLPLVDEFSAGGTFERVGKPKPAPADEPNAGLRVATPAYFRTMGIPVRRGRGFDERDGADGPGVAVINETAARRYWPNEDPIGQRLRLHVSLVARDPEPREIVGIVGDVRYGGLALEAPPEIYVPHAQQPVDSVAVVARTDVGHGAFAAAARRELRALDPELPLADVRGMEEVVAASLAERRFTVLLLTAFAAGAVVLAAVSLYGVLSYAVSRRTREIGVRLALGAHPARLVRQVVAQGVALTATGVALGVGGAMALGGVLSGLLYGVRANDPATHAAVAASLLSVAVAACLAPAWRASRVDPIEALRSE